MNAPHRLLTAPIEEVGTWVPGEVPFEDGAVSGDGLRFHPLANLFPMIEGLAFGELVADIRAKGLIEEIVVLDGQILDGRNRYVAWRSLGGTDDELARNFMLVDFREDYPDADPLAFVLSKNLARRHLSESQRAMIAAKLASLAHGGDRKSDQAANLPVETQAEAARALHVSERLVRDAKAVRKGGAPELAAAVETGAATVSAAAAIARLPVERQHEFLAEVARSGDGRKAFARVAKELRAAQQSTKATARAVREEVLGRRQRALPAARFGVIYADPEWRFEPRSRDTGMDRAPENHYPTSDLVELQRRRVIDIAADDCTLLMWATVPMLAEAFCVLDAWGFAAFPRDPATGFLSIDRSAGRYVSSAAWVKYRPGGGIGLGHWFRVDHEILLVATRGAPVPPAPGEQYRSVFDAPASRVHSAKPDIVIEMIEAFWPNTPKIELNRRGPPRPGWAAWGNEAED